MTPRTQTLVGFFLVLGLLVTGLVLLAPLCFTEGCTPQQRAADVSIITHDLAPAEACIVRQIALGELAEPLVIVAACAGVTVADVYKVTSDLLADEADAGPADGWTPPAPPMTAARIRVRALHARCRALLDAGAPATSDAPTG